MSSRHDGRPRYTPAQPTAEQLHAMREMLDRLSDDSDETGTPVPAPAAPDEPS